jgi:hypothetical protein
MQFFASKGFPCPTLRNPSDHYLRTINKDFDAVSTYIYLSRYLNYPIVERNHHACMEELT